MTRGSSLSLQNADSSRTHGAPAGSVRAAASPESAVSIRARREGVGGWGHLFNHCAVKSNHPHESPAKNDCPAVLTYTQITSPGPRDFPRCSPQLVTVYVLCVLLQGAVLQPDRASAQLLPLLLAAGDVSNSNPGHHRTHIGLSTSVCTFYIYVCVCVFASRQRPSA